MNKMKKTQNKQKHIYADLGKQKLTIAKGTCIACFKTEKDFKAGFITVRDKDGNTAKIPAEMFLEMGGTGIEIQNVEISE